MSSITGVKIPPPETANSLNLKTLDAASQAARVQLPSATRGPKADRLQLVAKIAPIAESQAAEHNWSATGVAITGGKAYVSWHSNHQAKVQADAWGGAIDEIDINALATKEGTVITNTQTSERAKFNNVVTDGTNLYFPITDYNVGAVVGRLPIGAEKMDTIGIPGSSANAIVVRGADLYAVTGYAGAAYKMPAAFTDENKVGNGVDLIAPYSDTFGGKYIDGDYILGTTDANAYLLPLAGGEARSLGAPLKSTEKYAEAYDPANGEWYPLEGEKSAHYGKHTMAVSGDYIYVGGGKGVKNSETGEGVNGLRVYGATGDIPVWENGTNTTAVCVAAVKGTEYVFAATGAGLRVYEKFDGKDLKLFAYEVVNYDENGKAIGHTAGTDAHSSNFVAVDPTTGMIFVACGQSGVYVFNLDPTVQPEKNNTGFKTTTGIDATQEVEEGSTINVTVPDAPEAPEGKEFDHWLGDDGKEYTPGDETPFEAGKVITLEPVWKDHVYKYVLKFVGWTEEVSKEMTGVPAEMKSDTNSFTIPSEKPVWQEAVFYGWSTQYKNYDFEDPNLIKPNSTFVIPDANGEGQIVCTLYGVWGSKMQGGTGDEEPNEPKDPVLGGEDSNGKD